MLSQYLDSQQPCRQHALKGLSMLLDSYLLSALLLGVAAKSLSHFLTARSSAVASITAWARSAGVMEGLAFMWMPADERHCSGSVSIGATKPPSASHSTTSAHGLRPHPLLEMQPHGNYIAGRFNQSRHGQRRDRAPAKAPSLLHSSCATAALSSAHRHSSILSQHHGACTCL